MSPRISPRPLLVGVLLVAFLTQLGGVLLTWHTASAHPDVQVYTYFREGLINAPATLLLACVLTWRRPDHRVSWAFCALAATSGIQLGAGALAHEALAIGGGKSWGEAALFVSAGAQSLFVMSALLLIIVFPTGDVVSPRWRALLWTTFPAASLVAISPLLTPLPFADDPSFSSVRGLLTTFVPPGIGSSLTLLAGGLAVGCLLAGIVQLFVRFRRGAPEVRLQISWFFYAVVVAVLVLSVPWPGSERVPGWLLWSLAPLGIWTAVAVAILKHRLYDIDVVVNRTLVYGALTAILAFAYLALVVLLQRILSPVTTDSDLAIAGSTLTVAALFRPVRARTQAFIDHRFYRRKYDAGETLGDFSLRLRDQVDLDSLSSDLVGVVGRTMQPAHASLWLRTKTRQ